MSNRDRREAEAIIRTGTPVVLRVAAEAAVLKMTGSPLAAAGAGDMVERFSDHMFQRVFHAADTLPEFASGPVMVAPIPDVDMAPGFFVYTVKARQRHDGTWTADADHIEQVHSYYFSRLTMAETFARTIAPEPEAVEVLPRIDAQSLAHVAWSLWVDHRQAQPPSDDWYLREPRYHIGEVAAAGGPRFFVWQRAITNLRPLYFVLDASDVLSVTEPPQLFDSRSAAVKRMERAANGRLTWDRLDFVPQRLSHELVIDSSQPELVWRHSPPAVAVAVSGAVPLGRPKLIHGTDGMDTHPTWYLSPVPYQNQHLWIAWQGDPGGGTTPDGWPERIRLAVSREDPSRPLAWSRSSDGLQYFGRLGIWCQVHPTITPIEAFNRLVPSPDAPGRFRFP